jgi:phosphonatase-like hydrolase
MGLRSRLLIDLVAFDMGGTTVRDDGVVPHALRRALEPLGIRPTDAEVASVRGAAKRAALAALIERAAGGTRAIDVAAATEETYARFAAQLQAAYADGPVEAAAGAAELFAWLRDGGVKVALTTGFDRATRDLLLRRLGWDDGRLDAAVSAEDVAMGRPAPYMLFRAMETTGVQDVARLAAVGDTAVDLEAGTNAGARFVIGVLGGAHDLATLGRARHTHLLPRLEDLASILQDT